MSFHFSKGGRGSSARGQGRENGTYKICLHKNNCHIVQVVGLANWRRQCPNSRGPGWLRDGGAGWDGGWWYKIQYIFFSSFYVYCTETQ